MTPPDVEFGVYRQMFLVYKDINKGFVGFCDLQKCAGLVEDLCSKISTYNKGDEPYYPKLNEVCLAVNDGSYLKNNLN